MSYIPINLKGLKKENLKNDKEIQKILYKNKSTQTYPINFLIPKFIKNKRYWDPYTQSFKIIPKRLNRFDRIPNRPKKSGGKKSRKKKKKKNTKKEEEIVI